MAEISSEKTAPKRFYETVSVEASGDAFEVRLDGRTARTPKRAALSAPQKALIEAVASEWRAVEEAIDTNQMPLTKMLVTRIDLFDEQRGDWAALLCSYLNSDLLRYRAPSPEGLVARQGAVWTPYLSWFETRFSLEAPTTTGLSSIDLNEAETAHFRDYLASLSGDQLLAGKIACELSGSAVLAAALLDGQDAHAIFNASRLDELFQIEQWGEDAEAAERAALLERDFMSVADYLKRSAG